MNTKHSEYISLREAAKMSGYSSDYVGQLIRQGKLHGKQIFSNVAWVTTKEAVEEYMNRDKKDESSKDAHRIQDWMTTFEGITTIYQWVSYAILALTFVLIIFLLFIFAVGIDHRMDRGFSGAHTYAT